MQRNPTAGNSRIHFAYRGPDLLTVVTTTIRHIYAIGLRPIRVVNDDVVTLADIGDRIGRSREAVRLWATGRLGPGGFPAAINPDGKTHMYSWAEVNVWFRDHDVIPLAAENPALVIADLRLRLNTLTRPEPPTHHADKSSMRQTGPDHDVKRTHRPVRSTTPTPRSPLMGGIGGREILAVADQELPESDGSCWRSEHHCSAAPSRSVLTKSSADSKTSILRPPSMP